MIVRLASPRPVVLPDIPVMLHISTVRSIVQDIRICRLVRLTVNNLSKVLAAFSLSLSGITEIREREIEYSSIRYAETIVDLGHMIIKATAFTVAKARVSGAIVIDGVCDHENETETGNEEVETCKCA
jgi:hypothetical protein